LGRRGVPGGPDLLRVARLIRDVSLAQPASIGTREESGETKFSWAFVLRPVDADRTRLLLRARNNVAPMRLAGLLGIPVGLVDVYEGGEMLRGIRARVAAAGSVSR
jgi:hypothetical protein